MLAIEHAQRVINWQSNLPPDEMPPRWLWIVEDELEIWFEEVDAKRKERFGTPDEPADEVPMMKNELARGRR